MSIRKFVPARLMAIAVACLFGAASARATVTVSVQPANPVSLVGSNVTFTAQTSTSAGEIITGFTWKESSNNLPPFLTIAGATNSTFSIVNVQVTNAAFYFVSVTYNSGASNNLTAVSTVSQLIVRDQARLTSQPQSLVRANGQGASFSVSALGAQPLIYQWRDNGTNLADGGRISGSATNTLVISSLITNDTGNYDVVVSNAFAAVTSQPAALTVYAPPFVSVPPVNLVVVTGSNAVFSMVPGGSSPFTFQWKKDGAILLNGGRISGATSNVLTISGALTNDNGNYTVFFSNPIGSTNSVPVSLTVLIPPVITSPTNLVGQQGFFLAYVATATGSVPITFGVDSLPAGLTINSTNGLISGVPTGFGVFNVTLFATNAAAVASTNLQIALTTDVPGITSSLSITGQQGQVLTYAITASNNPTAFTATGLPPGLSFNPSNAVISGPPILSGIYPVTITASNQFGVDTEILTINLATALPIITSPLTARGTENNGNFSYTITASNSPTAFGAFGLPLGLVLDTNTGIISGAPSIGGTNSVIIFASNAYGTTTNTLTIAIGYATLPALAITSVSSSYTNPYLLDFTFSLRDDTNAVTNPSAGNAVVRPPEQLQVVCFEGNLQQQVAVPIPNETAFVVQSATTAKLFKTYFVLDYSFSMFVTPGAIPQMQSAVEGLIDQEPASAQFGVEEFSADYLAPTNIIGFTSDKVRLASAIENITNIINGNYAGTRFFDAMAAALTNFTSTNPNEQHYLVVMSDGNDDSSVLAITPPATTLQDVIVNLAAANNVKIYCVGFGPNPNTNVLQTLASQTGGNYYSAATPADVAVQFALLLKDLDSQYLLRWATLQRSSASFQPMFTVTVGGQTASFNTQFKVIPFSTNVVTNASPPNTTNIITTNVSLVPFYFPTNYAGNVQVGSLQLTADSGSNISLVTLSAFYVPRFVRELRMHYRANYPCTVNLLSTNTGDMLNGWSLIQTNDGAGGQFLTLASPAVSNVSTSLPYGIMGGLVSFQFQYQAVPTTTNAFSFFTVDNTIYSNLPPSGQSFTLTNTNAFVTNLPVMPPHGTPIPWLISFGFTNNFTNAELSIPNGNGLPLWQDYLAGLNPTNPASKFVLSPIVPPQPGQPSVITFSSVLGRTYRIDSSLDLVNWFTLVDNIAGTGGVISIPDDRNLSGATSVFYRVVLNYH